MSDKRMVVWVDDGIDWITWVLLIFTALVVVGSIVYGLTRLL